jgi:hypothetical protein
MKKTTASHSRRTAIKNIALTFAGIAATGKFALASSEKIIQQH